MMVTSDDGRLIYAEPWPDYLSRKHLYILLGLSSLVFLLIIDLFLLRGAGWSGAVVAFHVVLVSESILLLVAERRVWRYARFKIFVNGFLLPGRAVLPGNVRFVPFRRIVSAEATALPQEGKRTLLSVTIRLERPNTAGSGGRPGVAELTVTGDELRHRNLVRLWQEFVAKGIGDKDSLNWMFSTR